MTGSSRSSPNDGEHQPPALGAAPARAPPPAAESPQPRPRHANVGHGLRAAATPAASAEQRSHFPAVRQSRHRANTLETKRVTNGGTLAARTYLNRQLDIRVIE